MTHDAASIDIADVRVAPHAATVDDVVAAVGGELTTGLTAEDAAARLAEHGPNELAPPPRTSLLMRFLGQFRSMLILILVGASVLSAAIGEYRDAAVVAVVLLLNAVLGTMQEAKAQRSVDALQDLLPPHARVRRDGRVHEIPAAEVVVGDLLLVEAGDRIAADGRVVVDARLTTDQSSLTGESVPEAKHAADVVAVDAPVADRTTMAWMNTTVVRGRGEVLVTGTGMDTRIGQVAQLIADAPTRRTPLQRQIDALGRRLAVVAGVAVAAVFVVALIRGDTFAAAAMDAIALAIAAIPEGLPAVVTITLALGTAVMARHNAIVKRLSSVETLGSTDVVCTDKTGTLTRNEMTVRTVWQAGQRAAVGDDASTPALEPGERALTAMVRCNDADVRDGQLVGDPTETALLTFAARLGVDIAALRATPRVAEVPFDAATKVMATLHAASDGGIEVDVKGAPDVLLDRCDHWVGPQGRLALDEDDRDRIRAAISELAGEGLRTLAVATRHLDAPPPDDTDPADVIEALTFELLLGIVDPPREGVAEAVAAAQGAGIHVTMVTGDHPETAKAIARELGIHGDALTGVELDQLDDAELRERAFGLGVCARVAPEHKVRLVAALQDEGHITAMTGDGVNDAPALERADIGVAMGIAGTEVTKQAADLVLADDAFPTIVTAIERGRAIYDNILSFVRFQLATNIGAIIAILGARLIGLPTPFTPIQVLWVNLIMDGPPALALGADPERPGGMNRPPRDPSAAILDRPRLLRLAWSGTVMATGTLALFAWALGRYDDNGAYATTLAFTTFVLFQLVNALNARVEHTTVFSRYTLRNGKLWLALAGVLGLQVLAVQLPALGTFVDVVPLAWHHWLLAAAVASSLLVVEELRKLVGRRLRRRSGAPAQVPAA